MRRIRVQHAILCTVVMMVVTACYVPEATRSVPPGEAVPSRTATRRADISATATSSPRAPTSTEPAPQIPTPTEPPEALEEAPRPTRAAGIGQSRADIIAAFEGMEGEARFEFAPEKTVDGQATVLGASRNGVARLEIIGPPDDPTAAIFSARAKAGDVPAQIDIGISVSVLLSSTAPDWRGRHRWINGAMAAMAQGEDHATVHEGVAFYFVATGGATKTLTLTVTTDGAYWPPTDTIVPEPSPRPSTQPMAKGVGTSRATIVETFEALDGELGFDFAPQAKDFGVPMVLGTSRARIATLKIVGPAENPTTVSLTTMLISGNTRVNALGGFYQVLLLDVTLPQWEEGPEWWREGIRLAIEGGETSTFVDGVAVHLSGVRAAGLLITLGVTVDPDYWVPSWPPEAFPEPERLVVEDWPYLPIMPSMIEGREADTGGLGISGISMYACSVAASLEEVEGFYAVQMARDEWWQFERFYSEEGGVFGGPALNLRFVRDTAGDTVEQAVVIAVNRAEDEEPAEVLLSLMYLGSVDRTQGMADWDSLPVYPQVTWGEERTTSPAVRTLQYVTATSLEQVEVYYKEEMKEAGWEVERQDNAGSDVTLLGANAKLIRFARGIEAAVVTLKQPPSAEYCVVELYHMEDGSELR